MGVVVCFQKGATWTSFAARYACIHHTYLLQDPKKAPADLQNTSDHSNDRSQFFGRSMTPVIDVK